MSSHIHEVGCLWKSWAVIFTWTCSLKRVETALMNVKNLCARTRYHGHKWTAVGGQCLVQKTLGQQLSHVDTYMYTIPCADFPSQTNILVTVLLVYHHHMYMWFRLNQRVDASCWWTIIVSDDHQTASLCTSIVVGIWLCKNKTVWASSKCVW